MLTLKGVSEVFLKVSSKKSNTRVLITGGAGFIGSHLCEVLFDRGHN
ncbi:MAG: NAD-dependent epimerase/dehydratase family protein [Nitrososphaerales archaeon]